MSDRFNPSYKRIDGSLNPVINEQTSGGPYNFNLIDQGIKAVDNFLSANTVYPVNSSLEVDSNGDGTPDDWTFAALPSGSGGIDSTNSVHGKKCFKMIHPGGANLGGGTLTSSLIPIGAVDINFLGFYHWATAAGMRNQVAIRFYDKDGNYIAASESLIYDSISNPATATYFICQFPLTPATARYYTIKLVGGLDDTNVAGTAYFDGLELNPIAISLNSIGDFAITEKTRGSSSYADVGSATVNFSSSINLLNCRNIIFRFQASLKVGSGTSTGTMRFRVNSLYSNEVSTQSTTYVPGDFAVSGIAGTPFTIYMQLKVSTGTAYGIKFTDPTGANNSLDVGVL